MELVLQRRRDLVEVGMAPGEGDRQPQEGERREHPGDEGAELVRQEQQRRP